MEAVDGTVVGSSLPTVSQTTTKPPDESKKSSFMNFVSETLAANPYFNAGAGLTGIGLTLAFLKKSMSVTTAFLRRRFITSLEMDSNNIAYQWLLKYINQKSTRQTLRFSAQPLFLETESGRTTCVYNYYPGHGTHYFFCNGRWIQVERERQNQIMHDGRGTTRLETVVLKTIGSSTKFFKKMLEEACDGGLEELNAGLIMYSAVGPEWRRYGKPLRKRSIDSVILKDGLSEEIQEDFEEFCRSADWYAERGIPYRRGYLFYGPPGTGKSSYITALASHYGFSICILSLSEPTLDDERLKLLLNTTPTHSIVLLEDVDKAFSSNAVQSHKIYEGLTRVTISGLLNAVDGVGCSEDRILFMTTNCIEKLDKPLIRPGRIDRSLEFGLCTKSMIIKMYRHFYGDLWNEELMRCLLNEMEDLVLEFSPAQLQGHLLLNKTNPRLAVSKMKDLQNASSSIKQN